MQDRKQSTRLGAIALTATLLLTSVSVATADTPFTATGWPNALLSPGITATNGLGQVFVRGNVHTARVQASDERFTGQVLIITDGAYNPDGTANVQGPAYLQVGAWDPAGTNFTPAAGLWIMTWRGVMQPDNSLQLSLAGYGSGGSIDGLRLAATLTRTNAASPVDPTVPYQYSGTIKPPPVNTNLLRTTFDGPLTGWDYYGTGSYSYTPNNGQLDVSGHWPGVVTRNVVDSYALAGTSSTWALLDGQTVEVRVDLVSMNTNAPAARLGLGTTSGFYSLFKWHDAMALAKWSSSLPWGPIIMLTYEKTQVPDANVILSLALTRVETNAVVTVRALDKANPAAVLYERSVTDTPLADPALTSAEFLSLSGMSLGLSADLREAPFTTAGAIIGVWQYNDGTLPAAVATYDNLELRKYEIPPLGIAQAMALTWPNVGNYAVECAPTVNGPWLPRQNTLPPGFEQMTVPQSGSMQFFRLLQAP